MCTQQKRIFIVTGLSGAGKSSVLHFLEDLGFFCIDNPPHSLIMQLLSDIVISTSAVGANVALGIDCRSRCDMQVLADLLVAWREKYDVCIEIIYLEANRSVLLKRFQETRRKHPLARACDLSDAFLAEEKVLRPLRVCADHIITTDVFTIHELRYLVRHRIATDTDPKLLVRLMSFGFKHGFSAENNFVFDVRSLPNPYFVPDLRAYSGKDPRIVEYLFAQREVQEYWDRLRDFVAFVVERSYHEGRFFVDIAIGCTGGFHRSVAFVQKLSQEQLEHVFFIVKHRDIDKVHSRESFVNRSKPCAISHG